MIERAPKRSLSDLAMAGAEPLFARPRSTSSLVRPDFERFLAYSREFHQAHQFTNNGPLVQQLETRLASFHGTAHCVSFCSGFWALVLAIRCLALPGRREVIMPSLTYRRMADVASWAGLTPRFCEVDADSLSMTPALVEPLLNQDTALILGVHPIVNCFDAPGMEALARDRGVPLLIDAVESVRETIGGRRVGGFGRAEVFSLHASKLLNGFEGGYLTTDDAELAGRLALIRGFGFQGPDEVVELGMNAKLNEIHAAMALAGLDQLEEQIERNRALYLAYREALAAIPSLRLVAFDQNEACGYKNILLELLDDWPLDRARTLSLLNAENVLARAYYAPPLHQRPYAYPVIAGPLPVTERLGERFLLLPCGHFVDAQDVAAIATLLHFLHTHADGLEGLPE